VEEQFGHVLIEAMGIPVIGSTCGEIPNVMVGRTWCFRRRCSSAAAILERMIRSQPGEKKSNYSITRVCQHYTHERIAERLVSLWRKILEQNREHS